VWRIALTTSRTERGSVKTSRMNSGGSLESIFRGGTRYRTRKLGREWFFSSSLVVVSGDGE
jgi:hypothetical protein